MHSDQPPPSADVKPLPGPWHDRYFKSIFKTPEQICALLQLVFHPLLLALFDLGTLRLRPNKISKPDSLTEFVSDRLVSVRLKDGDEVGIHLLFEHKSAPDRGLMFQLGRYMLDLLEHQAALVVPVTLYHGKADWQPRWFADLQYANQPARLMELIGNSLLNFENFLISLREESVQAVLKRLPLLPALALEIMAHVWDADAQQYAQWMGRAARLEGSVRESFIAVTKEYLWKVRPSITMLEVKHLMEQAKQPGDEAMQATIDFWEKHQPDSALEVLEIGRQEGIEEGIEKGIEKGKQQMAIEMARRLIENGSSDTEVEKYTDLSLVAIRKLRNGA